MGTNTESRLRDESPSRAATDTKKHNPDTEIRTDDEKDTLYNDGLDVEDDSETYADTHGNKMPR